MLKTRKETLMPTPFDEQKATQAAARFLRSAGGSMDRIKFVKLMYLLDRRSLLEDGATVTFDSYYSLPHGPVPSQTYNLVRNGGGSYWPTYIASPNNKTVVLKSDPGTDRLTQRQIDRIDKLALKYKDWHGFRLRNFTHELAEYQDPGSGRIAISLSEMLEAQAVSAEEAKEVEENFAVFAFLRSEYGA